MLCSTNRGAREDYRFWPGETVSGAEGVSVSAVPLYSVRRGKAMVHSGLAKRGERSPTSLSAIFSHESP
jgi:hypothetical protein